MRVAAMPTGYRFMKDAMHILANFELQYLFADFTEYSQLAAYDASVPGRSHAPDIASRLQDELGEIVSSGSGRRNFAGNGGKSRPGIMACDRSLDRGPLQRRRDNYLRQGDRTARGR